MKKKFSPRLKLALQLVASIVILGLLADYVEWKELENAFREAALFPLFAAFLVTLPFPMLNTLRWLAVVRSVNVKMSVWQAFRITMACWPLAVFTPGKAGEFLKATFLPSKTVGFGTVYAERVVDLIMLGSYGVIFGAILGSLWSIIGGLAAIGISLTAVLGAKILLKVFAGKKIGMKLEGLHAVLPTLLRQPRFLIACALSSSLNWWLSMVQMWFLLEAFGHPAPLLVLMAIVPGATLAGLLPITPSGVGTRDAAFLFLGVGFIDQGALLASAIFYSLFGYLMLGTMGIPFMNTFTERIQAQQQTSESTTDAVAGMESRA